MSKMSISVIGPSFAFGKKMPISAFTIWTEKKKRSILKQVTFPESQSVRSRLPAIRNRKRFLIYILIMRKFKKKSHCGRLLRIWRVNHAGYSHTKSGLYYIVWSVIEKQSPDKSNGFQKICFMWRRAYEIFSQQKTCCAHRHHYHSNQLGRPAASNGVSNL